MNTCLPGLAANQQRSTSAANHQYGQAMQVTVQQPAAAYIAVLLEQQQPALLLPGHHRRHQLQQHKQTT
jgi:hypothetical protein